MDVENLWRQILAQRAETIRPYFCPDAVIQWPCTNERFTLEEYLRANCEYPGRWDGEVERIDQAGEVLITVAHVFARDQPVSCHVTSFIRLSGGRIASMEEYWADDGPAPLWRQELRLGRPIR
jgi:ketosteroid isomerase-like protein